MQRIIAVILALGLAVMVPFEPAWSWEKTATNEAKRSNKMELGAFSLSLSVKDIAASRAFYEKLGFNEVGGDQSQNWLILRNGATTIGLFQDMFPNNSLTFNPGWDKDGQTQENFMDIREIQNRLKSEGIALQTETDEAATGPSNITLIDPDGNPILIDQHVAKAAGSN